MADFQPSQINFSYPEQREKLEKLVERFINNPDPAWIPLREILQVVSSQSWRACLFGGLMYRLLAHGFNYKPRDVDIVLDGVSTEDLQRVFAKYPHKWTRFGGIRVQWRGWTFDLWPLDDTWAFREKIINPKDNLTCGFDRLPESTFLDIEAVAVELTNDLRRVHQVYEHGIFNAIQTRQVDINLEINSAPEQAVVRSLILACQLQYTLGPKLINYIASFAKDKADGRLLRIQRSLYGAHPNDAQVLKSWLQDVTNYQRSSSLSQPGLRLRKDQPWLGKKLIRPSQVQKSRPSLIVQTHGFDESEVTRP